jgi:hypothetical protein
MVGWRILMVIMALIGALASMRRNADPSSASRPSATPRTAFDSWQHYCKAPSRSNVGTCVERVF